MKAPAFRKKNMELIFERFERGAEDINVSGLGLGLFISRQIANGHKGVLTVESETGRGSTFILKIPKTQS